MLCVVHCPTAFRDPLDQELWGSEQEGWPLLSAQHQFVVIIGESVHWTQTVTDKPQAGWKPDTCG